MASDEPDGTWGWEPHHSTLSGGIFLDVGQFAHPTGIPIGRTLVVRCRDCPQVFGRMFDASVHEIMTGHRTAAWDHQVTRSGRRARGGGRWRHRNHPRHFARPSRTK